MRITHTDGSYRAYPPPPDDGHISAVYPDGTIRVEHPDGTYDDYPAPDPSAGQLPEPDPEPIPNEPSEWPDPEGTYPVGDDDLPEEVPLGGAAAGGSGDLEVKEKPD